MPDAGLTPDWSYDGKVYDASTGTDEDHAYAGIELNAYLLALIDTSEPEEADATGGTPTVLPYHLPDGIK